jgi:proline iminopeptidase
MWSDARVFGPMLDSVRVGVRTIPIDFPGHGRRKDEPPARHVEALARELLRAVAGPEPAVLAGISMGAIAALHAALLRPHAVAGLLLFAGTPFAESAPRRLLDRVLAAVYGVVGPAAPLRWAVRRVAFGPEYEPEDPFGRQVIQWAEEVPRATVAASLRLMAGRPTVARRLHEITIPVAVVVGDRDRVFGPGPSRALARGLVNAELRVLRRTGHAVVVERPRASARLLEELLERVGPHAS